MVKDAPTLVQLRDQIHELFDHAHVHVAHNIAFDDRILAQEIRRLKLQKFTTRPLYCTMKQGVEITKIPSDRG
jgi:DNA polymerase III epsilon subunit-like protein